MATNVVISLHLLFSLTSSLFDKSFKLLKHIDTGWAPLGNNVWYNESEVKPWSCGRCYNRYYKDKSSLLGHLKFECGVMKQFSCSECGHSFARRSNLRAHYLTHRSFNVKNINVTKLTMSGV